MSTRLTRSLSLRLLLIFLLLGVLFAYGAQLAVRWVYATDQLRDLVSGHLSLHVQYVRQDLGFPPDIDRALAMTEQVPIDIRLTGPDLDWASHPDFPSVERLAFGNAEAFSAEVQTWLTDLQDVEFAALDGRGYLRMANGPYTILVATPALDQPVDERQLVPVIIAIGLALVLLAYLAVRWLFKPLDEIREGAASIAAGQLEHRIQGIRQDELGDLASEINTMADQVQRMLDAKRQLLLGISHELRTPLSRSKLALELAEADEGLDGVRQDLREMETIIGALLEAERLNDAHHALARSSFTLAEMVDNMLADYFARDAERIQVDIDRDLVLFADRARLTLMLKNLIANALRYGRPDEAAVLLQAHQIEGTVRFAVQDHGPGFDDAQAKALGEPFFRSDGSRTRGTGGTGLGLYLARLVAEAHGGSMTLDRQWAQGARLVVRIPLKQAPEPT
ncbi:MAG: HAMP domain-containing sensor histidine kinase [Wenzhouxiangella sp.]|jgi:signal transduction histidine kinase|nr:HAMP domain-containing sensor histidine kinase [Wenzhouxiangella sp.]